ncbi:MAG TPA: hypothetical protein VF281_03985 [Candidatus Saccharimonadales bacterium]
MSAEAVVFSHDISINFDESTEERRVRLHHESASLYQALHEMETRHNTLTLGLIAIGQSGDIQTRQATTEEHNTLAQDIAKLRQEQAQLIIDIANCNRTIWRPPYNEEHKAARHMIESPYIAQIYNEGVNPDHGEPHSRYLTDIPE